MLLLTWHFSRKSTLHRLVHDVAGDEENDPDVARRMLAEMDAAAPSVVVSCETFHYENRGSGKNHRRVRVSTGTTTQALAVVSCANAPGTELAPQWERLVRSDGGVMGSVVSVDVGVELQGGSDVVLLGVLQRMAAEVGRSDAHFTLSWRVHAPQLVHKVSVSNGVPGACAVAGYWLALLTLQGWLWSLCTERRVHRSDALLVKRLVLAPFYGPLGSTAAAGAAAPQVMMVMLANPMQQPQQQQQQQFMPPGGAGAMPPGSVVMLPPGGGTPPQYQYAQYQQPQAQLQYQPQYQPQYAQQQQQQQPAGQVYYGGAQQPAAAGAYPVPPQQQQQQQ